MAESEDVLLRMRVDLSQLEKSLRALPADIKTMLNGISALSQGFDKVAASAEKANRMTADQVKTFRLVKASVQDVDDKVKGMNENLRRYNTVVKEVEASWKRIGLNKLSTGQVIQTTDLEKQLRIQKEIRSVYAESIAQLQRMGQSKFLQTYGDEGQKVVNLLESHNMKVREIPTLWSKVVGYMGSHLVQWTAFGIAIGSAYAALDAFRHAYKQMVQEAGEFQVQGVLFQSTQRANNRVGNGTEIVANDELLKASSQLASAYGHDVNEVSQDIIAWRKSLGDVNKAIAMTNEGLKFQLATGTPLKDFYTTLSGLSIQGTHIKLTDNDKTGFSLRQTHELLERITAAALIAGTTFHNVGVTGHEGMNDTANMAELVLRSLDKDADAAGQFGLSLSKIIAINTGVIASLGASNSASGEASEKISRVFGKLAEATTKQKTIDFFTSIGVSIDTTGHFIDSLAEKWDSLSQEQQKQAMVTLGGSRQFQIAANIVDAFGTSVKALASEEKNKGELDQIVAEMQDTLTQKTKELNAEWNAMYVIVGGSLMGVLGSFYDFVATKLVPAVVIMGSSISDALKGWKEFFEYAQAANTLNPFSPSTPGEKLSAAKKLSHFFEPGQEPIHYGYSPVWDYKTRVKYWNKDMYKAYNDKNSPYHAVAESLQMSLHYNKAVDLQKVLNGISPGGKPVPSETLKGPGSGAATPGAILSHELSDIQSKYAELIETKKELAARDDDEIRHQEKLISRYGATEDLVGLANQAHQKKIKDDQSLKSSYEAELKEAEAVYKNALGQRDAQTKNSKEWLALDSAVNTARNAMSSIRGQISSVTSDIERQTDAIQENIDKHRTLELKAFSSGAKGAMTYRQGVLTDSEGIIDRRAAAQAIVKQASDNIDNLWKKVREIGGLGSLTEGQRNEVSSDQSTWVQDKVTAQKTLNTLVKEERALRKQMTEDVVSHQNSLYDKRLNLSTGIDPNVRSYLETMSALDVELQKLNDQYNEFNLKVSTGLVSMNDPLVKATENWHNQRAAILETERALAQLKLVQDQIKSSDWYKGIEAIGSDISASAGKNITGVLFGEDSKRAEIGAQSAVVQKLIDQKTQYEQIYAAQHFHTIQQEADHQLFMLRMDQEIKKAKDREEAMKASLNNPNFFKKIAEDFTKAFIDNAVKRMVSNILDDILKSAANQQMQQSMTNAGTLMFNASQINLQAAKIMAQAANANADSTQTLMDLTNNPALLPTGGGGGGIAGALGGFGSIGSGLGVLAAAYGIGSGGGRGSGGGLFGAAGALGAGIGLNMALGGGAGILGTGGLFSMLAANPLLFGGVMLAGALLPSLFHHDNPAQMPDKYDTSRFNTFIGEMTGSGAADPSYGSPYVASSDPVQKMLGGKSLFQYIGSWVASHPGGSGLTGEQKTLWDKLNSEFGTNPTLNKGKNVGDEFITSDGQTKLAGTYVTLHDEALNAAQSILQLNSALAGTNQQALVSLNQFGSGTGFFPYAWNTPGFEWPAGGTGNISTPPGGGSSNGGGSTTGGSGGSGPGTPGNPGGSQKAMPTIVVVANVPVNMDGREIARVVQSYTYQSRSAGYQSVL